MSSDAAFFWGVAVCRCLKGEVACPLGRRRSVLCDGNLSVPTGERDGSERAVRVCVRIGVQWAGVPGGGSSGPAHARLLPHAEPQLRAGHREGLLPGWRVCVPEVLLPTAHHHHREDHSEQHGWVSRAAVPWVPGNTMPQPAWPLRRSCGTLSRKNAHRVHSHQIPPMPYKAAVCFPAFLFPQLLAIFTPNLLSLSPSLLSTEEIPTTRPRGTS